MEYIGITEGADPTVNLKWRKWVQDDKKPAILITKMPRLLLPMLKGDENVIIHCTITGYGKTEIEPNIDLATTSLKYYHELCKMFGAKRVVLRIDPIIPPFIYSAWQEDIAEEAKGRVRISFMDAYPHVRQRFEKRMMGYLLPEDTQFHYFKGQREAAWYHLGKPEVCGEPDLPCTPCVSALDCEILGIKPSDTLKGQRKTCGCLSNKKELLTPPGTCTYGCLYCYWK